LGSFIKKVNAAFTSLIWASLSSSLAIISCRVLRLHFTVLGTET
jgi:hypothetical protein